MKFVAFVTPITALSQAVCIALWRASWQGSLAALAVWTACRLFPRLPSAVRCWLWRIVFVKFVLTLAWPLAAIPLPFLRAADTSTPMTRITRPVIAPSQSPSNSLALQLRPLVKTADSASPVATLAAVPAVNQRTLLEPPPVVAGINVPLDAAGNAVSSAPLPTSAETRGGWFDPMLPMFWTVLFALYVAGVVDCVARLIACGFRTRCFVRIPRHEVSDSGLRSAALDLCCQMGIKRVPGLFDAADVSASQLVAAFPPRILLPLLPERLGAGLDPHEARRLMLAHELAHLRRGDLWWSSVSALTHALFFFLPFVWLARKEEEMSREMACDALVLATTLVSPSTYGAVLVEAAGSWRPGRPRQVAIASLGIASQIGPIRQRLLALRDAGARPSTRRLRRATCAAAVAAMAAFLPWRVVAAGEHGAAGPEAADSARGSRLGNSVVTGQVLLLPDNETAANCSVTLEPVESVETTRKPKVVRTDVEGKYHFDAVSEGVYLLSVQPDDFWGSYAFANIPGKSSRHITIGAGQGAIEQNLSMTKITAAVTGQVFDTRSRQSVAEAEVGVGSAEGGPESVNFWESVRSDGRYRIAAAPGQAAVYVRYHHFVPRVIRNYHVDDEPINPYRLVPADTARLAKVVSIEPGHAVEADISVNAHYSPAPNSLAPITGRVTGTNGRPAARAEVFVFNIIRTLSQQQHPAMPTIVRTGADGRFRVDGIPASWAGTRLDIRARGARDCDCVSRHCLVTLPAAGTTSGKLAPVVLHLDTSLAAVRSGRVVEADGRPAAYVLVDLHLESEKRELLWANDQVITDADGRYSFARLWPDLNEGWIDTTPGIGSRGTLFRISSAGLKVNQGAKTAPIVLKPTTSKLAGVVLSATGKPATNARIIVIGSLETPGGGTAITDSEGRFRLDDLQAGSYHVGYGDQYGIGNTSAKAENRNLRLVLTPRPPTKP